MHDAPVVFASREARALAALPPAPKLLAVGGFDGQGRATAAVDPSTLDIRPLAARLAAAFISKDVSEIGAAATESAEADQATNPKPHWADLRIVSAETGASGVAVSHSGSAVALLFAPDRADDARRARSAMAEFGIAEPRLFRPFG